METKHSFFPEREIQGKENEFAFICIFAISYHTDKEAYKKKTNAKYIILMIN